MIWGFVALAAIVVGLPVVAWMATRGMARRPAAAFKPYHDGMDKWIHQQYGLDWADCRPIRKAVAEGARVTNPALEDAAHRLAAATLSGKAPAARLIRVAIRINIVTGSVLAAFAAGFLLSGSNRIAAPVLFADSLLFFIPAGFSWVHVLGRQRNKAARALELNQPAAHRGRDPRCLPGPPRRGRGAAARPGPGDGRQLRQPEELRFGAPFQPAGEAHDDSAPDLTRLDAGLLA